MSNWTIMSKSYRNHKELNRLAQTGKTLRTGDSVKIDDMVWDVMTYRYYKFSESDKGFSLFPCFFNKKHNIKYYRDLNEIDITFLLFEKLNLTTPKQIHNFCTSSYDLPDSNYSWDKSKRVYHYIDEWPLIPIPYNVNYTGTAYRIFNKGTYILSWTGLTMGQKRIIY